MKTLNFYFDPISPYAALAFERLPEALAGCSYEVEYRPVLFAAILHALGQKGPAEIESKRHWTFRQVSWLAHQQGIALDTPAQHPFNPLPLLRLAWASGSAPAARPTAGSWKSSSTMSGAPRARMPMMRPVWLRSGKTWPRPRTRTASR